MRGGKREKVGVEIKTDGRCCGRGLGSISGATNFWGGVIIPFSISIREIDAAVQEKGKILGSFFLGSLLHVRLGMPNSCGYPHDSFPSRFLLPFSIKRQWHIPDAYWEIGWLELSNIHRIRRHWNGVFSETSSERFPALLEEPMGMIGTCSRLRSRNPLLLPWSPLRHPFGSGVVSHSLLSLASWQTA